MFTLIKRTTLATAAYTKNMEFRVTICWDLKSDQVVQIIDCRQSPVIIKAFEMSQQKHEESARAWEKLSMKFMKGLKRQ